MAEWRDGQPINQSINQSTDGNNERGTAEETKRTEGSETDKQMRYGEGPV